MSEVSLRVENFVWKVAYGGWLLLDFFIMWLVFFVDICFNCKGIGDDLKHLII